MHVVPPPMTRNYMPPKSDFAIDESKFTYGPKQSKNSESDAKTSDISSCESNSSVKTLESVPKPVTSKPKAVNEPKVWSDAPIIEEYKSDNDVEYVFKATVEQEKSSCAFINTVKHVKPPRQTVKDQDTCSQNPKVHKRDWTGLKSKRLGLGYGYTRKACFDNPHQTLKGNGIIDSGCSRHMTGNKASLKNIKTFMVAVLLLEHFNLFSVSQIYDKKNKVLFTDTKCLVLSPDFKLPNENQVLLRVPGQNNMYSFHLENIVFSRDIACLIAKAIVDKSNKWHKRGMTYDKVGPIFEREYKNFQTLFKLDKDVHETKTKRVADETLLQESFKKLRAAKVSGSESTQEIPSNDPKEMTEEDVQNMLEIVPVPEEFKVKALQVKYPIIDWEIHTEDMLKRFDREDLVALWNLVKEKFSSVVPSEDKEKALWVELKRLFELDTDDVQKDYPLLKAIMILMLSGELQVEEDNEMARDLVMKIFMEANKPRSKMLLIVRNKMHKAFPLPGESSHWQYKFPLPVKVVPTAKRLEMPLSGVYTAIEKMMKKLPILILEFSTSGNRAWRETLILGEIPTITSHTYCPYCLNSQKKMDHQYPTVAKIPVLDTEKFEQWQFQIQQFLQHEHYALWEVIEFGDSYKVPINSKEYLSIRPASSDKEMELWVELKRMYEPDPEDQLWTLTQNYMHAPVEWKLYDLSGVHHVTAKDNEIFMLVEKDYPLRRGLALVMISYRLQVENYSQMAEDLIRKIYNIANTLRKQRESSHWQYKFPLPVKVVPTARRLEMPLLGVCTAIEEMLKKLPVKDRWQLH
uniref:Uncharacterized protein n=1 Tax=Tanacetum cinerariifolium TaxID=118510 RepID=A0A699H385_TANCI|nr:hypothetical protein [Tanacetum cinerariifolium]